MTFQHDYTKSDYMKREQKKKQGAQFLVDNCARNGSLEVRAVNAKAGRQRRRSVSRPIFYGLVLSPTLNTNHLAQISVLFVQEAPPPGCHCVSLHLRAGRRSRCRPFSERARLSLV